MLNSIHYELGILAIIGAIGIYIANRNGFSSVVSYIIIGIILGPYFTLRIGEYQYNGLLKFDELLTTFSELGMIILIFFIGLSVAPQRLLKLKSQILILAFMDIGTNLFSGLLIGQLFGWSITESLFLGLIIGLSSIIITAEYIEDFSLQKNRVNEALLGLLLAEDFIGFMAISLWIGVQTGRTAVTPLFSIFGFIILILFFIILTLIFVPAIVEKFHLDNNDELITVLAIGTLFMSVTLAELFQVTPIIGAFFAGMLFGGTKLREKIISKLKSVKYFFGAIFFITFGMMINLNDVAGIIPIVIVSVIAIIITELILLSSISYLIGFDSKSSVYIGVGTLTRSEESIVYSSIATQLKTSSGTLIMSNATLFYPIAGLISLIMCIIPGYFIKRVGTISGKLCSSVPLFLVYSGNVIRRTLRPYFMEMESVPRYKKNPRLAFILVVYFTYLLTLLIFQSFYLYLLLLFPVIMLFLWFEIKSGLVHIAHKSNYQNIGMTCHQPVNILNYVTFVVALPLNTILLYALLWPVNIIISLSIVLATPIIIIIVSYIFYLKTTMKNELVRVSSFQLNV